VTSLIELEAGTQPLHYLAGAGDATLLLAGSGGFGLLARGSDLGTKQRGGKSFLSLEAGETMLAPAVVQPGHGQVACLSAGGRLLVFPLAELKLQPNGGRGLTLMDVDPKDPLLSVASFGPALKLIGQGRASKAKEEVLRAAAWAEHAGKRARKGRKAGGFVRLLRVAAE
jgi:topoisomerase-4 subunit A